MSGADLRDVGGYAAALDAWLAAHPDVLDEVRHPIPVYADRVSAMCRLMGRLWAEGWARWGWPESLGGLGGDITHRAAMWPVLARHGLVGMALFEHAEVLVPTLAALGPPSFVAHALPAFLSGRELWCQGFSEPDAGSDLANLRTRAEAVDGGWVVRGRKIWTSWAKYATWCLLLVRTGTPESRHRGLSALIVDLRSRGVEVSPIVQANGTDELAEVAFDEVFVPAERIVGDLGGGWAVAMHILSHERGTFAWFRHCFLRNHLAESLRNGCAPDDRTLGEAVLDLAAVSAAGRAAVREHAAGKPLGPRATFPKLLLATAEQSANDTVLSGDADLAVDPFDDFAALQREEYLFSRIVTVYGGSQQMQLETIGKQVLHL